jgi:hypothetical protein
MSVNVRMISVLYKIYGNNKNMQDKDKIKNLIKNIFLSGNVKNALMNLSSIVLKDVFNKTGLSNISLYVQASLQKQGTH